MPQEGITHPIRKITLATISYFLITAILITVVVGLTGGRNSDYVKYVIITTSVLYGFLFHKQMRIAKIKHVTAGILLGVVISGVILFVVGTTLYKTIRPFYDDGSVRVLVGDNSFCSGKETIVIESNQLDEVFEGEYIGYTYVSEANPHSIEPRDPKSLNGISYFGDTVGSKKLQLLFSPKPGEYYVDSKYFSEPIKITLPAEANDDRYYNVEKTEIAQITKELEDAVSTEELTDYFIKNLFIRTYQHLGSNVCITDKLETTNSTIIRYKGSHNYSGRTGKLDFGVEYDKATKKLYLIP